VKGAFTGAVQDKVGLFEAANGGTLFLDEVGEMTPATQVRLLRALQEREVIPVGSTEVREVDVRILAATNSDLNEKIRSGSFRSDVYYRLNVIALHLPPLRERKDDIPLLAHLFLDSFAEQNGVKMLGEDALAVLCSYDWPGNVRELENALERAVVVASDSEIAVDHLPEVVRAIDVKPLVTNEPPPNPSMEVIERAYIEWVLTAEGGNKSKAAEVLGIDPSTLYRKLNRYGIEV
jgi:two-component system response regulator HydG